MRLFSACLAGLLPLTAVHSDPVKKSPDKSNPIKLITADKVTLKGDFLMPKLPNKQYQRAGAVILLHGGEGERADWWNLQGRISNWGAATLTIDLRGHGESGAGKSAAQAVSASASKKEDVSVTVLNPIQEDLKSAVLFLRKQKNIDPNRITVIGVDVAAAAAVRYAANDLNIKGVGIISPEAEIPNFNLAEEAKKLGARSIYLLAPASAKDMTEGVAQKLNGTVSVFPVVADGEAKGMELFSIQKTTEPKLTTENSLHIWLRNLGALTPGP